MSRILLLLFCLVAFAALGQTPTDTVSLWRYQLETRAKTQKDKSIGSITFWRDKPVNDSVHFALHQEHWTPQISFSIFPLSDSAYCRIQNTRIKNSSTCLGPDVGGDIYRIGEFILLNREICLSCLSYVSKVDYCRPVVNKALGSIDGKKVKKLTDLEKQLDMQKGDRYK